MIYWLLLIFIVAFGACVGSFLNVVIYRLPEGGSLVRPGSHCPHCHHVLRWWENVPVLAWFYLLGKCRRCGKRISAQYPVVEATCAILFGLTCWSYYVADLHPPLGSLGLGSTWPLYLVHLVLIGALLAATLIDARWYIIPLEIPWFAMGVAMVVLPVSAMWMPAIGLVTTVTPGVFLWVGVGGVAGLVVAIALLSLGVLPRSFEDKELVITPSAASGNPDHMKEDAKIAADEFSKTSELDATTESDVTSDVTLTGVTEEGLENDLRSTAAESPPNAPDAVLAYPHARREVLKECLFLFLPVLGAVLGYAFAPTAEPGRPLGVNVLGGVLLGYLVGGVLVWVTRIAGTLGFGKEAMGLGDVHLLAAIGAVIGPVDTIVVFFVAPFVGLFYTSVAFGMRKLLQGQVRVIPYGPYLATVSIVMMILRSPMWDLLERIGIGLP